MVRIGLDNAYRVDAVSVGLNIPKSSNGVSSPLDLIVLLFSGDKISKIPELHVSTGVASQNKIVVCRCGDGGYSRIKTG